MNEGRVSLQISISRRYDGRAINCNSFKIYYYFTTLIFGRRLSELLLKLLSRLSGEALTTMLEIHPNFLNNKSIQLKWLYRTKP